MSAKFSKNGEFVIDLRDFSGGINDRDDPREIADNETPDAKNEVINRRGASGKRYGFDAVAKKDATGGVRGLFPFPMMDGTKWLLLFHGGEVFAFKPDDFEWGEKKGDYGTDNGEPVGGTIFQNLAIFSNGAAGGAIKKWDGTAAVADLGGSPPVNTNIFSKIDELLLLVKQNRVYWCAPSLPEDYTTENKAGFQLISSEDGEFLTALVAHGTGLVAFTEIGKRGCSVNYDETNVSIGLKTNEIVDRSDGAIGGRTAAAIRGGGIFFLAEDGFKSFGVDADSPLMRTSRGLSEKTPIAVARINRAKIEKAVAAAWKDQIFCAVPTNNSEENDAVFLFDPIYRGWALWEMPISDFAIFENEVGKRELYFGHSREPKLCKLNRNFFDDYGDKNTAIEYYRRSKTFSPSPKNKFKELVLTLQITSPSQSEVEIVIDGETKSVPISSDELSSAQNLGAVWGNAEWDDAFGGAGYDPEIGPPFYDLEKKIAISSYFSEINTGAEMYFRIKNNRAGESIQLRRAVIRGEILENAF
jgi:hypothetical protein